MCQRETNVLGQTPDAKRSATRGICTQRDHLSSHDCPSPQIRRAAHADAPKPPPHFPVTKAAKDRRDPRNHRGATPDPPAMPVVGRPVRQPSPVASMACIHADPKAPQCVTKPLAPSAQASEQTARPGQASASLKTNSNHASAVIHLCQNTQIRSRSAHAVQAGNITGQRAGRPA